MLSINTTLFHTINQLAFQNALIDRFMVWITTTGSVILFCGTIGYVLLKRYRHEKLSGLVDRYSEYARIAKTLIVTYLFVACIKIIVALPRPFLVLDSVKSLIFYGGNNSFPSGHAAMFAALSVAVWYRHRWLGAILGVCTVLIGFSRVFVGVHYPLDVFAGFVIGAGIAILMRTAQNKR